MPAGRPLDTQRTFEYKQKMLDLLKNVDSAWTATLLMKEAEVPKHYYYSILKSDSEFKAKLDAHFMFSNSRLVDRAKYLMMHFMNYNPATATAHDKRLAIQAASKIIDTYNDDGTRINNRFVVENNTYQFSDEELNIIKEKYADFNRESPESSQIN
jgi:hypothetical protein